MDVRVSGGRGSVSLSARQIRCSKDMTAAKLAGNESISRYRALGRGYLLVP